MQHQMQQQQQQQFLQSQNQSSGSSRSIISAISDTEGSRYSMFEASMQSQKEQLQKQQQQHPKLKNDDKRPRPPLSPVPFHPDGSVKPSNHVSGGGSTGNNSTGKSKSSRKKKKIFIESSAGFTFDAFGLDPNEIDNEVNATMLELEDSNLDLSLFAASEDCSTSSGSSSAIARKMKDNY